MSDPIPLTCYLHPGWAPHIRPASPRRDWMDATPEAFAYRCLPLAIANAHGWEILSPCGFWARWAGGTNPDALEIRLDAGTAPADAAVSLFGQGIVTFHVAGLFRTPPEWNLFITGPLNAIKDGLAPLSGIIETDWSPYTFTMNWRFTRVDHWVRFDLGEPFAFFFPVERALFDRVEPRFAPLADDPALATDFEDWSRSRTAFQAQVVANPPSAPTDRWQKLYYRGIGPSGQSMPAPGHRTKLRVSPFE